MSAATETDAYFAGFFDADGSVMIAHPPGRSHWLIVSVWQNTLPVLRLLKDRYGGTVQVQHREQGNKRAVYVWKANHAVAEAFLKAVLPWLVVKRERAELALEFRKTFGAGPNCMVTGRGTAADKAHNANVLAVREAYRDRLMYLNRRGVAPPETKEIATQ